MISGSARRSDRVRNDRMKIGSEHRENSEVHTRKRLREKSRESSGVLLEIAVDVQYENLEKDVHQEARDEARAPVRK